VSDMKNTRVNKFGVKLADTDDSVASKISWDPARPEVPISGLRN